MAHRTRSWTSQDTRTVLLDAGWDTLRASADEGRFDLDVPKVLARASQRWKMLHGAERDFTRGAITSLWPAGIQAFRQAIVLEYLGNLARQQDRLVGELSSGIRLASRGTSVETRRLEVTAALSHWVLRLLEERMDRRTSTLLFTTLLQQFDLQSRHAIELSQREFEDSCIHVIDRAIQTCGWDVESSHLYFMLLTLAEGALLEWTVRPKMSVDFPRSYALRAATALCAGLPATTRIRPTGKRPPIARSQRARAQAASDESK